ncbi:hypothetical protein Tco_1186647 [Tanacetum coccineum]
MGYALEIDARVLIMFPTKNAEKTPYGIWHGKAPKLSFLRVWGCHVLIKRYTSNKLEIRTIRYKFVGYQKETTGYYFYYPEENKVFGVLLNANGQF